MIRSQEFRIREFFRNNMLTGEKFPENAIAAFCAIFSSGAGKTMIRSEKTPVLPPHDLGTGIPSKTESSYNYPVSGSNEIVP